ncbi:YobI family P-loop NTPase [Glutamicibacter arilaitensis]|uniref:YobI family P-loop NTPase n=1 Tax=Glutamicibacter arilaitensis TaxID=256701 RepID=UPI003F8E4022
MKSLCKTHKRKSENANSEAEISPGWNLTALTPEFIKSEHAQYATAIAKNLENNEVLNIALSGNYGVGKSSILRRVAEDHPGRVVELSLSTLSPIESSEIDESVPVQATTPTNRIQQEIVKQLLYRAEPKSARASRFRRIERFSWGREISLSLVAGLLTSVALLILGWASTIERTVQPLVELELWIYPVLVLLASALVLVIRGLLHGRIHIRQFSAGPAAVTLDEKSVSYFDQYLDEIVYFFETSKYDIVIFEDIDRFNDSHIFETLRSLNTLLNASPQIKKPIRFIYAIKDSIFDREGLKREGRKDDVAFDGIDDPAQAETIRANRTKFFDLVIPVVPFITHRSARNLTSQILKNIEHEVSNDLIDLAGRFVPDMRLLKNVRNEFVVFRDRIFSGDGKQLNLSETHLFAMMLYKSTHLSDFEVVRLGKSKLDQMYETSRTMVTTNIRRVESELRDAKDAASRRSKAAERAVRLGKRLVFCIELIVRASSFRKEEGQYLCDGKVAQDSVFQTVEFWEKFSSQGSNSTVGWHNPYYNRQNFQLTRNDVAALVGESLDAITWRKADEDGYAEHVGQLEEKLKFLRSADMNDLMKRSEFRVTFEDKTCSLAEVAENLFTKGLAYSLIRGGYIDRNFTLYTSTFHGDRVSPAAMNFIIHHVERGLMDEQFMLTAQDVEAVIREQGTQSLGESAMFNISILNHLLGSENPAADVMVTALARLDADSKRFLQGYFNSGSFGQLLVKKLMVRSTGILGYLVSGVELADEARRAFISAALLNLSPKVKQALDGQTKFYLATNYPKLAAIGDEQLTPNQSERVAALFMESGVLLSDLAATSKSVRPAFVKRGLYEMSLDNLRAAAAGGNSGLALDELRASHSEDVYAKALSELSSYLDAVEGQTFTNVSQEGFIPVVKDVLKAAPELLDRFVSGVSDESHIEHLEDVPQDTWSIFASHNCFSSTYPNVSAYVEAIGRIDEHLAVVLSDTKCISHHDDVSEEEKRSLAVELIGARTHLDPILRATLAESLKLEEWIPISDLPVEDGVLYVELISRQIISSDQATYAHLLALDWKTREPVIAVMPEFHEWVTPEIVGSDLGNVLASAVVSEQAKRAILDRAGEYTSAGGPAGLIEVARLALAYELQMGFDVVEQMAAARVPVPDVIALLRPHLDSASDEQLFGVLRTLGAPYLELTTVGRDKPKVPNTPDALALLESLRNRGIVASFDGSHNPIKVSKRHKEQA